MRLRTRVLIAACFVIAFALVPEPDRLTGRPYIAYLQVREWLLGPDSPLLQWPADRAPALAADVRQSPPLVDATARRQRAAEYARLADEWAHATGRSTSATAARPVLPLLIRIGSDGVRAELATAAGGTEIFERRLPGRESLLPALVTIAIAVLSQQVLLGLLCGGLVGAFAFVGAAGDTTAGVIERLGDATAHLFGDALWRRSIGEDFYLQITVFVALLFMTVAIVTRNGGVHGLVARLQRRVKGPRSAQTAAVGSGLAVFFDDYTNCLLVGTTMRPLFDRVRVAREKLAYLVDSTAAPVAGLSVFSTWVVYEMSQYRTPLTLVTGPDGVPYAESDAFAVFLDSLPYRFYSWFTLLMVALVALLGRDFGPMLRAERRARHQGMPLAPGVTPMVAVDDERSRPPTNVPLRARNAALPLAVLVIGTFALMLWQGVTALAAEPHSDALPLGEWLREVLARARSTTALLYAAATAWLLAVAMTLTQRLMSLREVLTTSLRATRSLYLAFGILFLAWSLGHICHDLGTSFFLTAAARDAMHAAVLPLLLFAVAGAMAFATGTSFGTMAILLPNVVVLSHQLGTDAAFGGDPLTGGPALMLISIGAVLEGAIFGDHCSPISDTTVLSSLGAQCDLLGHVTTQLPYAALTAATATCCGYLPVLYFGPDVAPIGLLAGALVLWLVLRFVGRDPSRPPAGTGGDAA